MKRGLLGIAKIAKIANLGRLGIIATLANIAALATIATLAMVARHKIGGAREPYGGEETGRMEREMAREPEAGRSGDQAVGVAGAGAMRMSSRRVAVRRTMVKSLPSISICSPWEGIAPTLWRM